MDYIWQKTDWPQLSFKADSILKSLAQARQNQGRLLELGRLLDLKARGDLLVEEVISTSAIEGEKVDADSVRSSVARRLGLPTAGLPSEEHRSSGLVDVLIDATEGYREPLSTKRIHQWHRALFPMGVSGLRRIEVGSWREGPMQVVSGSTGKERVHFSAPPADKIDREMKQFVAWWNDGSADLDGIVRAALAHLYFVTIHPYEDGNGRIARALTDMALAQDEKSGMRLYSLSSAIVRNRTDYYEILEQSQKSGLNASLWINWFLGIYSSSIKNSLTLVEKTQFLQHFYRHMAEAALNPRQIKVMGKLLEAYPEEFAGGLTNRKYVSMTKTTPETAKRDLKGLLEKQMTLKGDAQGRSTFYLLNTGLQNSPPAPNMIQ